MDENNENQNSVMSDNQNVGQQYNNVDNSNNQNMNTQQPIDNLNTQQPIDNSQNMNMQQPVNNSQNMNMQQPVNNYQNTNMQQPTNNYQNQTTNNPNPEANQEKAPVILRIISFFIPLVGLIIYACNSSTNKAYAKSCGIPALVSFIIGIVLIPLVVMFILFAGAAIIGGAVSSIDYNDVDSDYYSYYYDKYDSEDPFSSLDEDWNL